MTSRASRRAALCFGSAHVAACLAGLARPTLYGPGLRGNERLLRALAALDAPYAAAVTHAALTGRPLAARLRAGALSDLVRACAFAAGFEPGVARSALIGLSLAGLVTAAALSFDVDAPVG